MPRIKDRIGCGKVVIAVLAVTMVKSTPSATH
jgi:hypothetical protein